MPFSFSSSSSSSDYCTSTETYFWGCTLTKNRPSVEWRCDSDENESHSLDLKQGVLGVDAVMNQRNVVQVEACNISKELLHLPILSLTLGRNDMCSLDLHFESDDPVTFRLIEGNGPVHIAAEHVIEYDDEEDGSESELSVDSDPFPKQRAKVHLPVANDNVKRALPSISLSSSARSKLDNVIDSVTSSTACIKVKRPVGSPAKSRPRKPTRAKKSPVAKQVSKVAAKPKTSKKSPKKNSTCSSRKTTRKQLGSKLDVKAATDRRKSCAL